MKNKPRLLFISPRFLFPSDEGGKIRSGNILRQMKGGAFSITLASPAPSNLSQFADELSFCCDEFVHWPAPRRSSFGRVIALARPLPVSVSADRSFEGRRVVGAAVSAEIDVIVTDFPHASVLAPGAVPCATVLFTHNIEAEIYERHAAISRGLWRHVWADQARKMAKFEQTVCNKNDAVIAVSTRDATVLRNRYGVAQPKEIVTGVDLDYFSTTSPGKVPAQGGTVVFTGVMDSPANIDAVGYFLREIWPLILQRRPLARAVFVGRNPPEKLLAMATPDSVRAQFTGAVADIRPHVAAGNVAIIPLRVGGGTRIKAFESMAQGLPLVSTSVGVEGLDITAGIHFLQADDAASFANAVVLLLADRDLRQRLSIAGRKVLEDRFTWSRVARQFESICLEAMAKKQSPQPII